MASLRFCIRSIGVAIPIACNSGARGIWENNGFSPEGGRWDSSTVLLLYMYADWGSGARAAAEYGQYEHRRDVEVYEKNNIFLYANVRIARIWRIHSVMRKT